MLNYNLGSISQQKARGKGEVVHKAWKEHNASLLLAEYLNDHLSNHMKSHIPIFYEGITTHMILTYMLSLVDLFPHKHVLTLREQFLNFALEVEWDTEAVLVSSHLLLDELLLVLEDQPTYTRQINVITAIRAVVCSIINCG